MLIMIWFCPRPAQTMDMIEDMVRWNKHLPFDRLQKMHSYRSLSDQWLCAAAYRLLQHGIFVEHGIEEVCVQVDSMPSGKPFLKYLAGIHFNISHCEMGAVCALSEQEIGVDIECFSLPRPQVMKHVLSNDEYEYAMAAQCPDKVFTRLWTLKESWLKATGLGLAYGAKRVVVNLTESYLCIVQDGFIAKIAWENEAGCLAQCCKNEKCLPVISCTL